MATTDGCDVTPYRADRIPGEVRIPFGFDLAVEAAFVRDGQVVWSNVGAPVRLSELLATLATAEDLDDIARDLAVLLIRRKAEYEIAGG